MALSLALCLRWQQSLSGRIGKTALEQLDSRQSIGPRFGEVGPALDSHG